MKKQCIPCKCHSFLGSHCQEDRIRNILSLLKMDIGTFVLWVFVKTLGVKTQTKKLVQFFFPLKTHTFLGVLMKRNWDFFKISFGRNIPTIWSGCTRSKNLVFLKLVEIESLITSLEQQILSSEIVLGYSELEQPLFFSTSSSFFCTANICPPFIFIGGGSWVWQGVVGKEFCNPLHKLRLPSL